MRLGGIKRGESKLASNHFLVCAPQSGPVRDVHGVTQKRVGGGRRQRWPGGFFIKKNQKKRRGIKKRERDPASNKFLKCSPPSGTHKEIHRVG